MTSRLLLLLLAVLILGCGDRLGYSEGGVPNSTDGEGDKSAETNATVTRPPACDRGNIVIDAASVDGAHITQSEAEWQTQGELTRSTASDARLARVTIGTGPGAPLNAADIKRDLSGQPISGRPAWVLRFDGQLVALPGGVPAKVGMDAAPRTTYRGALVTIIDAASGLFLYGYTCQMGGAV